MMTPTEKLQQELHQRHATIVALRQLWEITIAADSCPEQPQFSFWLDRHRFEHVAFAIREAGRKQLKRGTKMDADHLIRFVSSVANRVTREAGAKTAHHIQSAIQATPVKAA
jgi:hypothetical protein